jgi:hypothetical protein
MHLRVAAKMRASAPSLERVTFSRRSQKTGVSALGPGGPRLALNWFNQLARSAER